jgi:hypothetical protein
MDSLVNALLERWNGTTITPPPSGAECGKDAGPPDHDTALRDRDVCRLCTRRIESSDTVAAGGDDVVHTSCYDQSLEPPPPGASRPSV